MENMMEFTIDRDLFLPVLKRICAVSKSGAKDYERYGMISLKAEKERVLVSASNGYIHAVQEIKDENKVAVIKTGEAVVKGNLLYDIVDAAGEDNRLKIVKEGKTETSGHLTRTILGQKRKVSIPFMPVDADVELPEVVSKNKFIVLSDIFLASTKEVLPFAGEEEYKERYKFVYVEFWQEETRFVATDGSKVAIIINKDDMNSKRFKSAEECKGYIIQASQAAVLCELFDEPSKITGTFSPMSYLFETDTGLRIVLVGIQLEYADYLPYAVQRRRFDERSASAEVSSETLAGVVADMRAVRDISWEKIHNAIPIKIEIKKDEIWATSTFSNILECSMKMENYKKHKDADPFIEEYPLGAFDTLLKFGGTSQQYEFSFLGKRDVIFCKFLDDNPNRPRLLFFGPVVDTD